MRLLFFIVSILVLNFQSIDLNHVRNTYKEVAGNKEKIPEFNKLLHNITKNDKVELVAYKGAGIALKGRYAKKIKDKRDFFVNGVTLVEYVIKKAPNNIELRFIRLGIQENTPKLLKYKGNIEDDKNYIFSNYSSIKSSILKTHIKNYIKQSKVFSEEEKSIIY